MKVFLSSIFLLMMICQILAHKTLDATEGCQESDDTNFQYMMNLLQTSTVKSLDKSLYFYWNSPTYDQQHQGKVLKCRMVYQSLKTDDPSRQNNYLSFAPPSYLALGIQSIDKKNVHGSELMIGGNTIVGSLKYGVSLYELNNIFEGPSGVEEVKSLNSNDKTMALFSKYDSSIDLHLGGNNDSSQGYNHKITYDLTLFIDDGGNIESNRKRVNATGDNLFLFAIGPSSPLLETQRLGGHVKAGSFLLDFNKVDSTKGQSSHDNLKENNYDCASDDSNYNYMIQLPSNTKFYWTLDPFNEILKVQMKHIGNSWLGFGIPESKVGKMIGSVAIIGNPALSAANGDKPLKYHLSTKQQSGVYPMKASRQTLIDASIEQVDGETILRFSKKLHEENEHPIDTTTVTSFIYAIGQGNMLSLHSYANSFKVDLKRCEGIDNTQSNFKSSWMVHGIFGSLAFAAVIPLTATSAILRKLIPTTWMYYHVYGNVLGFAFTLCTVFIAISTTSMSGNEHFMEKHHRIGLTLLILTSIQVLNGLFRPQKAYGQLPGKARNIWAVIHRLIGLILLCLGLFQVGDGLNKFANDYKTANLAPYYFVFLIISTIVVLGTRLWLFVSGVDDKVFTEPNDLALETEAFDARSQIDTRREVEMT